MELYSSLAHGKLVPPRLWNSKHQQVHISVQTHCSHGQLACLQTSLHPSDTIFAADMQLHTT